MIAGASDHPADVDLEGAREVRRRQRLEWARRSLPYGCPAPDPRPDDRDAQPPRPLGGSDWFVDVGLVERHRIVRGWSRLQLATAAHVDPKTLRDLLGRRRRPNLGTVQAVSVALGLTLTDVIRFA